MTITTVAASPGANLNALIAGCASPSAANQYNITLAPGNYDQTGYITNAGSGIYGIQTRDYVHIVSTELNKALQPRIFIDRPSATGAVNYEVFRWASHSNFENVRIDCRNGRYPIHINEGTNAAKKGNIINCTVEHLGCWVGGTEATFHEAGNLCPHGLGVSIAGGSVHEVINSTIIGRGPSGAVGGHNWIGPQSSPSSIIFRNTQLLHNSGGASIMWQNIGTGQFDTIQLLEGCILNAPILYEDHPWLGVANANHNETRFSSDGTNSIFGFVYKVRGGTSLSYRPSLLELSDVETLSTWDFWPVWTSILNSYYGYAIESSSVPTLLPPIPTPVYRELAIKFASGASLENTETGPVAIKSGNRIIRCSASAADFGTVKILGFSFG